jgi:hypothetical protein
MTSAAIMAANSATLAATGENERDFLESYAMQLGLQRSSLTDMAAMGGRLLLPNSRGGVSSMSLGPFTYDVFMPQSKAFQGINSATDATIHSTLGTGTLGAITRGIKTAAFGVVSKFAAADLFSEGMRALYTQQTSRGDPLKTGHDWIKYGLELFTPPGAPGSPQYEQTRNVLADREVNPRTGRATTPIELAQSLVLRARPFLDSPARFQLAMTEVMKGKEEFYNFQRNIAYDDMLTTRLAQGGVYRPDGSLDVDKATPIAEEFYREHPVTTLDLKTKERIPTPTTATQVQEALKRYNSPGALTSFHSLPLDRQIEIYAHWRNIDREAPKRDPKWTALVKDSILSKLRTGRSSGVEHTQAVRAISQQLLDSGLLPKDAADDVRTWTQVSTELLLNSFEHRR